jgi:hypothetical protein
MCVYNMLREKGAVDHTDGQKVLVNCFRAPASRYQRENSKTSLERKKKYNFFLFLFYAKRENRKKRVRLRLFSFLFYFMYVSFVPASIRIIVRRVYYIGVV